MNQKRKEFNMPAQKLKAFLDLYGMDVFVSPSLEENDEISFNAGTHTEVTTMAYRDFQRLVQPKVMRFTT
jgi:Ala-tRNA(Pro) deacylase